jgi:hypothetical protein
MGWANKIERKNVANVHLYNKCAVAKFGAADASILSQILELQGFF